MPDTQANVVDDFELRSADAIRQILDIAEVGLWEWNIETGNTIINRRWATMLGYSHDELTPLTYPMFTSLLHSDDRKVVQDSVRDHCLGHLQDYRQNFRMKHKRGHWVWIKARGKITRWKDDKPEVMTGLHLDISEVMRQSDLIKSIADVVPSIIYQLEMNSDGALRAPFASKKLYELFGLMPDDIKLSINQVIARIHKDDFRRMRETLIESASSGEPWVCEYRVCLNNTTRWMLNRAIPQHLTNGGVLWHGLSIDISLLKETEQSLRELAVTDGLTQWYNRRHFMQVGEKMFDQARRQQNRLSLLMFDLDHFKVVNDTYGHAKGDEVLQIITQAVSKRVRSADLAARIGGEEFVVLLDGTNLHDARQLAEDLRKQIEKIKFDGGEKGIFQVTCSFGVTMLHPTDTALDQLLKRSDEALYQAKANGRNRVELG